MQFAAGTILALAFATLLGACSMLPASPDMGMGAGPAHVAVAVTPFTAVERDFVTKIATRTVYEIEVSKLAADRALSPAVRDFATRLAQDDTLMNDDLVVLMSEHGVAPPRGLAPDRATKLHKLAALARSDAFDNGYIRVVGIEDRRKTIAMFERARTRVKDRDLRAWMERALTVMRVHLAKAQAVASSLAG
jgi:putative membrane protein